jgi:ribose 5-phosphate isomerase B
VRIYHRSERIIIVHMRIAVAADHAGFELKQELAEELRRGNHEVVDLGAHRYDKDDDYPDFAAAVGRAIQAGGVQRGVLICGSGVGASIAANKLMGVRAGLCHDTYSARQGVEHDDMNVLVLGSRIIDGEFARDLVNAFLGAVFSNDERHRRRLEKVRALETNPTA